MLARTDFLIKPASHRVRETTESNNQLNRLRRKLQCPQPSFDLQAELDTMIQVSEFDFSSTQPGIMAARSVGWKTEAGVYTNRKGTNRAVTAIDEFTADYY